MLGGGTAAPVIVPEPAAVALVGRERHLEALQHAFRASVAGRPIWLFAHGPSGMGKSAVVDHFTDALQSRSQALVLAGRCYEQESVRYKALDSLVDALSRHLAQLPADTVRALLPEDIALLARMFPMLERVDGIQASAARRPAILSAQELRNRASVAFAQLLGALAARQPLVLAIDDLQWGDSDSAGLLVDMFSGPHAPAVLLVGSHRAERAADSACLAALLREDLPLGVRAARAGHRRARALRRRAPGAGAARPGLPDGRRHGGTHRRRRPAAVRFSSARWSITCRPNRSWPGPACWRKAPRSTRSCDADSAVCAAGRAGCWT